MTGQEKREPIPCVACQSAGTGTLHRFYVSGRRRELAICEGCMDVLGVAMQEVLDEAAHAVELHFRIRLTAERGNEVSE